MKAIVTGLCLIAVCAQLQAEDVVYAREVQINQSNQKEHGISVSAGSAGWPKGVLVFSIVCPSEQGNQKFMHIGLDLIRPSGGYYFRTSVATFARKGVENGSFQIDKSKIKDCKLIIVYRDDKGVNIIHRIDLKSYLKQKKK